MTTKQSRHKYKNKKDKTIMVSKMPSHEIHISRIGTSAQKERKNPGLEQARKKPKVSKKRKVNQSVKSSIKHP